MNKKEECEIVRDLSQKFMEKSISEESEKFVKNHLKSCGNCKEYYLNQEKKLNNDEDEIMINQFKKINRHIFILKASIIFILVVIISIFIIFCLKVYKTRKILNDVYKKVEETEQINNYKLEVKTIDRNLKTGEVNEYNKIYYYKDGKYKIEDDDSVRFYQDNSCEKILVYYKLKQIEYYNQDFIEITKGKPIRIFNEIINYRDISNSIYCVGISIREERYNGRDCYVIRNGTNKEYRDICIDKEKLITVRVVNEDSKNFYREVEYNFEENTVIDEEVDSEIINSSEFNEYTKKNIEKNYTKELDLYYKLYNK